MEMVVTKMTDILGHYLIDDSEEDGRRFQEFASRFYLLDYDTDEDLLRAYDEWVESGNISLLGKTCEKCSLWKTCKTPFMPGSGETDDPRILIVGEAPGADEDETGGPFTGRSGKLLREALELAGIAGGDFRMTNAVKCRPPNNKTPTKRQLNYCSGFLEKEILIHSPSVVLLLGNSPLKSVLGESGITNWNGVVVDRGDVIYVPAFHPAYILRNNTDDILKEWMRALKEAANAMNGKILVRADNHYEYIFPEYLTELEAMRDDIFTYDGIVSYDVESVYLAITRPENKILTISFSIHNKSWSFPVDHGDSWWDSEEREGVLGIIKDILTSHPKIVGHNIRFDRNITHYLLGIDFIPYGDTMLMSRLIDSRRGIHGLKRLAGRYLGMYDYARGLDDYCRTHPDADYAKEGNYGHVPLDILIPYGGMDTAATWLLYPIMLDRLDNDQKSLYKSLIKQVDVVLGNMEYIGFPLDKKIARRFEILYSMAKDKYYMSLLADEQVQELISRKQLELDDAMTSRSKVRKMFEFNPNSGPQVAEVLYDLKNHKITKFTETKKPSIGKDTLALHPTIKLDSFYEPYRLWKLLSSMLSKSIGPCAEGKWDWGDDRVRSSFNIGGTKTGRLSSSDPNLQNIPSPVKEPGTLLSTLPIKNMLTHSYDDGCLLSADYAGMELRVIATISNCTGMINSFISDEDIHSYVCRMIFRDDLPADAQTISDKEFKKLYKHYRDRAKRANWVFVFGGDEVTLHTGPLNLPLAEALVIKNGYYDRFPEILQYQKDTIEFAEKNGYVLSKFGRRLYLPYILDDNVSRRNADRRTGINMPVQSAASDIMLCALVVVDGAFRKNNIRSSLVNTVHDSLVVDVYPGELDQITEIVIDSMENVPTYADRYFPGLDFSWLNVPLKADTDVGSHYGTTDDDLIDFGEDYPDYDFSWFHTVEKKLGSRLRPIISNLGWTKTVREPRKEKND